MSTPTRTRASRGALAAALLLPALVAGVALTSVGDRVEGVRTLPAAVVNLDEPVTTGKGDDATTIAGGRLLAAGLTAPAEGEDPGMEWRLASADTAEEGLADGTFHAVVTIPEDFSSRLAGMTRDEPQQAGITVATDGADGTVVGAISSDVAEVAAARLGRQVTTTYLTGLYAQTAELGDQLGEAADGADDLADGADRLANGVSALDGGAGELASGAGRLADGTATLRGGLGQLDDGADDLSDGTRTLADGVADLDGGLGRLADGAGQLRTGTRDLADGAGELADGADDLSTGLDTLAEQTAGLPNQSKQLAAGATQVSGGVDGWAQVLRGWAQACASPTLAAAAPELCAGTAEAIGPGGARADALVAGAAALADGTQTFADSAPTLASGVQQLQQGASTLADGAGDLSDGAEQLAGGASTLSAGVGEARKGTRGLKDGSARLADGARSLAGATGEAASGASDLAEGASGLAAGAGELSSGTGELNDGAAALRGGTGDLAAGLRKGVDAIPVADAEKQQADAEAIAQPVVASRDEASPRDARAAVGPAVAALALWLGAFLTYLAVPALAPARLARAGRATRVMAAGLVAGVVVVAVQAVLVVGGLAWLAPAFAHPWALALLAVPVVVVAFAALAQTCVAALGERTGWIVLAAATALQVVTVSGFLPMDAAPGGVQLLHDLLPVPLAAELLDWAVNGAGSAGPVAGLLVWAVIGVVVTTAAASRARRTTVAALRRDLAAVA